MASRAVLVPAAMVEGIGGHFSAAAVRRAGVGVAPVSHKVALGVVSGGGCGHKRLSVPGHTGQLHSSLITITVFLAETSP